MFRKILVTTVSVAAALSLAACGAGSDGGSSAAVPSEYKAMYDAAKKTGNGTITLYSPGSGDLKPVFDEFSKRFPGLRINTVRLVGVDLLTRLQNEVTSNKHVADVVLDSSAAAPSLSKEALGWYEPFLPEGADQLPKGAVDPNGLWASPFSGVYGLAYSTKNVSKDEVPTSWDALTDPRWKGKIATSDISVPNAASVVVTALHYNKLVSDDWDAKVAANEPTTVAQVAEVGTKLSTGASDVGIFPLNFFQGLVDTGAPVGFSPQTSVLDPLAGLVVKGAPNVDGAKLFLTWMLSKDAQKLLAARGVLPNMPGSALPEIFEGKAPERVGLPDTFEQTFGRLKQVNGQWAALLKK